MYWLFWLSRLEHGVSNVRVSRRSSVVLYSPLKHVEVHNYFCTIMGRAPNVTAPVFFFNNTLFVGLVKEDSVMVLGLGHSFWVCYHLVFHSLEFKRSFSFSSVLVSLEFCILKFIWVCFFQVEKLVLLCYSSFMPTLFLVSSLSLCSIWFPCPFMLIHLWTSSCVKSQSQFVLFPVLFW